MLGQEPVEGGVRKALGVSFQAVQKYERGTNVITPWKLMRPAETLGVPITYFFPEVDSPARNEEPRRDQML